MNYNLDLRGLDCPLPLIKTRKQLTAMSKGDILEVTSTSDVFAKDIHDLCAHMECTLVDLRYNAGLIIAKIQK